MLTTGLVFFKQERRKSVGCFEAMFLQSGLHFMSDDIQLILVDLIFKIAYPVMVPVV